MHYGTGFDNAAWEPDTHQMVLGDARTYAQADDVIGHELTHAVTQTESDLYYAYQAGAINESLSDVFGELIDLTNGTGNDTPAVRWLIGEDVVPGGAQRSMKDPTLYGQPDRMTSPDYWTSEDDGGGVHFNSGVGNKAAYLMVDGDTFNGKTVTGLGIDKTEAIYYEAAANLLTSASDYQDLYNALQQACANLTGTHGISGADCQEVKDALDAVEMNVPPPGAAPVEAPVCSQRHAGRPLLRRPREPRERQLDLGLARRPEPLVLPAERQPVRRRRDLRDERGRRTSGASTRTSATTRTSRRRASVALPAGTSYLRFNHAYSFDHDTTHFYDGGVVEYSTNGGHELERRRAALHARRLHGDAVRRCSTTRSADGRPSAVRAAATARAGSTSRRSRARASASASASARTRPSVSTAGSSTTSASTRVRPAPRAPPRTSGRWPATARRR